MTTQWQIPIETKELIFQIFADFGNEFNIYSEHYLERARTDHNHEYEYMFRKANKEGFILWIFKYENKIGVYHHNLNRGAIAESTIQEQDTTDDIMAICEFMQMRYLKYISRGK